METITSQFQTSPGLHHVFIAIGALSLSRTSGKERKEMTCKALLEYRTSLNAFRAEIRGNGTPLNTNSGLWTTFFLGIFEVNNHIPFPSSQFLSFFICSCLAHASLTHTVNGRPNRAKLANPHPSRNLPTPTSSWPRSPYQWSRSIILPYNKGI